MDRARYHHGDLREALVKAGVALLVRGGPEAVTVRGVARKAGVAHSAPAHHFRDKTALLSAIAADAFVTLAKTMKATAKGARTPAVRLRRIGVGYVQFARKHPEQFQLMFRIDLGASLDEPLAVASVAAFRVLEDAVAAVLPTAARARVRSTALVSWALVHGLASLWVEGALRRFEPSDEALDQLADEAGRLLIAALPAR